MVVEFKGTGHDVCFTLTLLKMVIPSFYYCIHNSSVDSFDESWNNEINFVIQVEKFDYSLLLKSPLDKYTKCMSIKIYYSNDPKEFLEKPKGSLLLFKNYVGTLDTELGDYEELEIWEMRTCYGQLC